MERSGINFTLDAPRSAGSARGVRKLLSSSRFRSSWPENSIRITAQGSNIGHSFDPSTTLLRHLLPPPLSFPPPVFISQFDCIKRRERSGKRGGRRGHDCCVRRRLKIRGGPQDRCNRCVSSFAGPSFEECLRIPLNYRPRARDTVHY